MTDHVPNMAPLETATTAPPPAAQEGVVADAVPAIPQVAPQGPESALTVITKPALLSSHNPALGQWAHLIRGRRLAHFELEEPLGVGGMAAVIRAKDTLLDRIVALKILPPEMAADAENIQRFHNEARSAAQLDHENIARVYYYGEDQGLHFIAFEYVEGETLHQRLERLKRLPVPEALQITLQVAAGLVHAAARGMVHRDIKPSNIIVTKSGRAKLVDMGLARSIMPGQDKGLTQSGMTLGTFDYISPEQALDPRAADCRSDIYSLGCSLYQMLTGRTPVPEGTAARKLHAHQSEAPLDPRQLNPEIPDEVAAVLSRMMAKDPHDRYQRPEYLVQHLLQLLQKYGPGAASAPEPGQIFVETILPRPPKQDRGVLFLIATCILLGWLTLQRLLFPAPLPAPLTSFGQPESLVRASNPVERMQPGGALESNPPPVTPAQPQTVQTAAELQQALRNFSGEATIQLHGPVFDLAPSEGETESCLLLTQGKLTLEGSGTRRPILRLTAPLLGKGDLDRERTLLTQRGGELTLRRLRIELDGGTGLTTLTAFLVQGGHLKLEECEFVQKEGPAPMGGELPLTALRVEGTAEGRSARSLVECKQCVFYGGQNGFVLEDSAYVHLEHCVFGPYQHPVRLKDHRSGAALDRLGIDLKMRGCSWLLGTRSLIATDSPRYRLEVQRSVISVPTMGEAGSNKTYFLVQRGDSREQAKVQMAGNYFHGLDGLVAAETPEGDLTVLARTPEELAALKPPFQDIGSILSDNSPWVEANPVQTLAEQEPRSALLAFRLKTTVRELRLASSERIKGTHYVLAQEVYPPTLAPLAAEQPPTPPAKARELVVEPGSVYPTLGAALGAVETEKEEVTILLKVNGPLQVRPAEIGNRQILLKAAMGYKPELVLFPETVPNADGETVLFKLHDGSLRLEQVGLRLDGTVKDATGQVLVAITGAGSCTLHSCQATLIGDAEVRSAVVAVSDPTGAMSGMGGRPPRPGTPSIKVENTLIRGKGDFLAIRGSRPFLLDMKNNVVALFGSLLCIDGNRNEMAPMADGAHISFEQLTAYVTTSLLTFKSSSGQAIHVQVQVDRAETCLFAVAEGSPLVRMEGPQNEQELKRRLLWKGKANSYGTSGSLLVWQSGDRMGMPHQYNRDGWGELWGSAEEEPRFVREMKFARALPLLTSFADVTPNDFRLAPTDPPDLDLANKGADLGRVFSLSEKGRE
jgi:serine/threonine protein kinase